MFNTPILYIIFNRLDTVKQTFFTIKKIKPKYLYVAADGARKNKLGEKEKCQEVRDWVLSQIDWNCELKTLFRDINLGCGKGPADAISWFFSNVEQGIILEDDCLAADSFFQYCENLLNYYKDNPKVMHIAGFNCKRITPIKNNVSYTFTAIQPVWGWASWKDRWEKYSFIIDQNEIEKLKENHYFKKKYRQKYWFSKFKSNFNNISAWDFQWTYCILKNKGYCCVPVLNQIKNIGFGNDSSHSNKKDEKKFVLPTYEILNIVHPEKIEFDEKLIKYTDKFVFNIHPLCMFPIYIKNIFKKLLKKIGIFDFIKRKLRRTHSDENTVTQLH